MAQQKQKQFKRTNTSANKTQSVSAKSGVAQQNQVVRSNPTVPAKTGIGQQATREIVQRQIRSDALNKLQNVLADGRVNGAIGNQTFTYRNSANMNMPQRMINALDSLVQEQNRQDRQQRFFDRTDEEGRDIRRQLYNLNRQGQQSFNADFNPVMSRKADIDIWRQGATPQDIAKADEYRRERNAAEMQRSIDDIRELANRHPALVGTPVSTFGGMVGSAITPIATLGAKIRGDQGIDVNDPIYRLSRQAEAAREGTMQGVKRTAGIQDFDENGNRTFASQASDFLVGTGLSMSDTLVRSAFMGPLAGAAQAGFSAASQRFIDGKMNGEDDRHALASALAQGVAEDFFEKYSLEGLHALKSAPVDGLRSLLLNMGKQGFTEGSEEFATDWANAVSDYFINGGDSEWVRGYNECRQAGMTDEQAIMSVAADTLKQSLISFGGGALSGILLGGGAQLANRSINNQLGQQLQNEGQGYTSAELAEIAQNMDISPENFTDVRGNLNRESLEQAQDAQAYLEKLAKRTVDRELTPTETGAAYRAQSDVVDATVNNMTDAEIKNLNEDIEAESNRPSTYWSDKAENRSIRDNIRGGFDENGQKAFDALSEEDAVTKARPFAAYYNNGRFGTEVSERMEELGKEVGLTADEISAAVRAGAADANKLFPTQESIHLKQTTDGIKTKGRQGKVKYQGIKYGDLTTQQKMRADFTSAFLNKGLGMDVVFVRSNVVNGKYQGFNGAFEVVNGRPTITIDVNAGMNAETDWTGQMSDIKTLLPVVSHELTHYLETANSEAYHQIAQEVINTLQASGKYSKGLTFNEILNEERIRLEQTEGRQRTNTDAMHEIVARACEDMLSGNKEAMEAFEKMKPATRKTIADHIKDIFDNIRDFFEQMLKGYRSDSSEAKAIRSNMEKFEKIRDMWNQAINDSLSIVQADDAQAADTSDGMQAAFSMRQFAQSLDYDLLINKDGLPFQIIDPVTQQPVTHVTEEHMRQTPMGVLVNAALANGTIDSKTANKQLKMFTDLMNLTLEYDDTSLPMVWEIAGTYLFSSVKTNSDAQYSTTVDYGTICSKTQALIDVLSNTMVQKGRGLTREEVMTAYNRTARQGLSVPCPVCYVFSRWMGVPSLLETMRSCQERFGNASKAEIDSYIKSMVKEYGDAKAINSEKTKVQNRMATLERKLQKASADKDTAEEKKIAKETQELQQKLTDLESFNWVTQVRCKSDGKGGFIPDPAYKSVPNDILLDLRKSGDFASKYPKAWKYRTTRGAGMGKAIMPYSGASIGDFIKGNKDRWSDSKNPFTTKNVKSAKSAVARAVIRAKAQNLIGGQRFQSTSDYRAEWGIDYLMTFLECQAAGSQVQLYTKVIEAVDMLASAGAECNLSIMPKDNGYIELANGKKQLVFSDVTGINFDEAYKKTTQYDNVQMILVGINDEHIRLAMADDRITFIIPWHSSGNSKDTLAQLMESVGETLDVAQNVDYSDTQTDKVIDNSPHMQRLRQFRKEILQGKLWDNYSKRQAKALTAEQNQLLDENAYLKELYRRFYQDESAQEYGVKLNGKQVSSIFPYEYWDKSLTIKDADQNGRRFQDYCASLGIQPRFSQFANDKGYWKLLIDRKMYNVDGTYHTPEAINVTNVKVEQIPMAVNSNNYKDMDKIAQATRDTLMALDGVQNDLQAVDEEDETDTIDDVTTTERQLSTRPDADRYSGSKSMASAQMKRDNGELLTKKEFDRIYSAHKLNIRGNGNIEEQIQSIMSDGFRGGSGAINVLPASLNDSVKSYTLQELKDLGMSDEHIDELKDGRNEWRYSDGVFYRTDNIVQKSYGAKKGDRVMLVSNADITNDKVNQGVKPFNYEILTVERDYQPYYELYKKAYDANKLQQLDGNNESASDENNPAYTGEYSSGKQFQHRVTESETVPGTNENLLNFLNKQIEDGDYITTYKAFLKIGDTYYSPMASLEKDENGNKKLRNGIKLLQWLASDGKLSAEDIAKMKMKEDPNNPMGSYGYYILQKSDEYGNHIGDVEAAYNPYQHSSDLVINDQFQTYYARPGVVVVECRIPKSEIDNPYWAPYAKDPTGKHEWKSGSIARQLEKTERSVYMTRYIQPVRELSDKEVAEKIRDIILKEEHWIDMHWNVLHPGVVKELESMGITIEPYGSNEHIKDKNVNITDRYGNAIPKSVRDEQRAKRDVLKKARDKRKAAKKKADAKALKESQKKSIEQAADDPNNDNVIRQGSDKDIRYSTRITDKNINDKLKVNMATFFSGTGTVDFALRNIVNHEFAVEYDAKIAAVYRANNGDNIYVDDVRNVDINPHKGKVEYFHASPVCKSYSNANNDQGEKPLDIETAQATADAIDTLQPKVVTVENVAKYRNSEAIKLIENALERNGYKYDKGVYRASDFGGATIRERMFLRAVKDGVLPEIDTSEYEPMTWYEAVEDLIPSLPKAEFSNYMEDRLDASGIDIDNLEAPIFILGGEKSGKLTWAAADKPAPTILTKSTEAKIVMPDGRVLRATPRVMARIQGLPDSFDLKDGKGGMTNAYKVVGNGVPTQLTQGIVGPLLEQNLIKQKSESTGIQYSIRTEDGDVYRGITISDADYAYSEDIKNGLKLGETRDHEVRFLENVYKTGERIALIRSGVGNFKAYATTKIGKPEFISESEWESRRADTRVPKGSTYDQMGVINGKRGKKYYPFVDLKVLDEEVTPTSHSPVIARFDDDKYSQRGVDLDQRLDDLVQTYGALPKGEMAVNDISVPKQTSNGKRVRRYARTVLESGVTSDMINDEIKEKILKEGLSYEPVTDKSAAEYASSVLRIGGVTLAQKEWDKARRSDTFNKDHMAVGQELLREYAKQGDVENVINMVTELAAEGTRMGQNIQAMRMLKKYATQAPAVGLGYIQRTVDIMNREAKKKMGKQYKEMKIDQQLADAYINASTKDEIDAALAKIYINLGSQVQKTAGEEVIDRLRTWRYMSMLGNPRTHVRNLVGNALFVPAVTMKNVIGATIESTFRTKERTKSLITSKAARQFAAQDAIEMQDILQGNADKSIKQRIMDERKTFTLKPVNVFSKLNGDALEAEDWVFLRYHYQNALAQYITANKFNPNAIDGEDLAKARQYAVKEAQKATYRDANKVSTWLNQSKGAGAVVKYMMEGMMPFKKTPTNILRRGIEYSPAMIVGSLTKGIYDLNHGNITVNEWIDGLSSGLTGTAIFGLGLFLASTGAILGGYKDDDDKEKRKLKGEQEYAVKIGNHTYTIDWAAPGSLPLFVGVETMYALRQGRPVNMDDISKAAARLVDPMINMSMLSGLNDTLDAISYADDKLSTLASETFFNLLGQYVPTLFGQVARTMDTTQRVNYQDVNKGMPKNMLYFLEKMQNKIPYMTFSNDPYLDAFGRENTTESRFIAALQNFVSPGYIKEIDNDRVVRAVTKLQDRTEENVLPQKMPKYLGQGDDRMDLTSRQYYRFQKTAGTMSYNIIDSMLDDDRYLDLNADQQAEAIKMGYDYAKAAARLDLQPEYELKGNSKKIYEAYEENGTLPYDTILDLCMLKNATEGVTGDPDPNKDGKTIPGSEKKNMINAILESDGSATDKAKMYEMSYPEDELYKSWKKSNYSGVDYMKHYSKISTFKGDDKQEHVIDYIKSQTDDIEKQKLMFQIAGYKLDSEKKGVVTKDGNFNKKMGY